jgi:hypothetical protein
MVVFATWRTAHEDPEKSTGFQAGALCKNC